MNRGYVSLRRETLKKTLLLIKTQIVHILNYVKKKEKI